MNAYLIIPTGEIKEVSPKNGTDFSLDEMMNFVQGWTQCLPFGDQWMLVNEEGQSQCKLPNIKATELFGEPICGTVLVCDRAMLK